MLLNALCLLPSHALAVTGCLAVIGQPAANSQAIECPLPPCLPNTCNYADGVYSGCGVLTTCVLQGEDPPVTNATWDEPSQNYKGLGQNTIGGKCGPPIPVTGYCSAGYCVPDCPAAVGDPLSGPGSSGGTPIP